MLLSCIVQHWTTSCLLFIVSKKQGSCQHNLLLFYMFVDESDEKRKVALREKVSTMK